MNEEEKQAPEVSQAPQASQDIEAPKDVETPEVAADPEGEKPNSPAPLGGRSVFAYLAVLFGAAFLLLLFAYLMQQRDSAEIMGNLSQLRESMGSIQSIDELTEENRALREEIEGLKEQVASLEEENEREKKIRSDYEVELDSVTDALDNVQHNLHQVSTAMGLFWQIDEAYVAEDFDLCRELVAQMEELVVPDPSAYLVEPDDGNGLTRSAAERYQEIVEALEEN